MITFRQRIPVDAIATLRGQTPPVRVSDQVVTLRITKRATHLKLSPRTRDPSEAKMRHAQVAAYPEGGWVHLYNTTRSRSSLGYLTPVAFAAKLRPQRASTLRHLKSSAPMPVAHDAGARNSQPAIPVAAGRATAALAPTLNTC